MSMLAWRWIRPRVGSNLMRAGRGGKRFNDDDDDDDDDDVDDYDYELMIGI